MDPNKESPAKIARPKEVSNGVWLLSLSLLIGGVRSAIDLKPKVTGVYYLVGLLLLLLVLGFFFFFVFKVSRGRNWARIVLLILLILGLVLGMPGYIQELRTNLVHGSVSLLIALLQLIGTGLLFMPNANAWFGKRT